MSNKVKGGGKVPKLRFPEFRDAAAWEEKKLDDACEVNPPAKRLPERFVYIDLESVEAGVLLKKTIIGIDNAPSRAQRPLKSGDVLFQMVRPYQKNNYLFWPEGEFSYVASTGYAQLRAHQSATFLFHYLHTDAFVDKVMAKATGSNYPAINSGDLSKLTVTTPNQPEQQKIADCLSSIDEVIAAQTRKLDAHKAHNKGLMRQLFPAEGESMPKLRFPEFRDSPEWEYKSIGEMGEVITGSTPSTADTTNYVGNWLFVSPADISDERYITTTKTTLTDQGFKKTRRIKANSVLFVCIGSTIGKVAQTTVDCATNQQINSVVPFDGYSAAFIYSALVNKSKNIATLAGKQAVPIINKTLFSSVPICQPKLPEQQRIGDFLSSIDDIITTQTQKIELLKAHKKGLMQQLFPAAGEAQG